MRRGFVVFAEHGQISRKTRVRRKVHHGHLKFSRWMGSLLDGKERGARREHRLSHRSSGRRETMDRPENASIGFF